jgi:hypothetical protein
MGLRGQRHAPAPLYFRKIMPPEATQYLYYLSLIVLCLEFNAQILLSGIRSAECFKLSDVSADNALAILPVKGNCNIC